MMGGRQLSDYVLCSSFVDSELRYGAFIYRDRVFLGVIGFYVPFRLSDCRERR
jgi:hypothetical protein